MADTPHRVPHPLQPRKEQKRLKSSVYFGILLYILRQDSDNLTLEQIQWITNYSKKLDENQLLRAGKFSQGLIQNGDRQVFHARDIWAVRRSIPWIEPFLVPEKVRIGKGYTDKGALRPLHKKERSLGEMCFWDEDIRYLLPYDYQPVGTWITADEVRCLLGGNLLELVVMQLNQVGNYLFAVTKSQFPDPGRS